MIYREFTDERECAECEQTVTVDIEREDLPATQDYNETFTCTNCGSRNNFIAVPLGE